jgi:hypothetical protein
VQDVQDGLPPSGRDRRKQMSHKRKERSGWAGRERGERADAGLV